MFAFLKQYKSPSEKAFLAMAIIALCQETLFIYPVAIISHIGPLSVFSKLIFPIVYFVLLFIVIQGREATRLIRGWDFGLIAFFALYTMISTTLNPKQAEAINEYLIPEILPCIPFLFLGICFRIDSISMDALGKWSCLAVVLTSFYRILYQVPDADWEKDYNMGAAYSLLPNILITINYVFTAKKKLIPLICAIMGVFYLFAMGTRGPIVIVFALTFVCYFIYTTHRKGWKVFISILMGALVIWLASSPSLIYILDWLGDVLSSMGLSTRAIEFSISGEFISNRTGRDEITDTLINQLGNMPFLGYGVLGENRWDILSAHNLYLQAIFDYGFLFGGLFLLFLGFISVKALLKSNGRFSQQWIIIWMVYVFVKGFFGGGVLRFEVFILIGSCLRILRMKDYEIQ